MTDIEAMTRAILQAQIVQALSAAPEAIEKLVTAALNKPVDHNGDPKGYGDKMPYLDYIVGRELREACDNAVRAEIQSRVETIRDVVKARLSSGDIVDSVTKAIVDTASESWRINVAFEVDKGRVR